MNLPACTATTKETLTSLRTKSYYHLRLGLVRSSHVVRDFRVLVTQVLEVNVCVLIDIIIDINMYDIKHNALNEL